MKGIIITVLMLTVNQLIAQELDSKKMDRDIKISEDVIASLVKSEADEGEFYSVKVGATYMPDFGVMINLERLGYFSPQGFKSDFDFHWEFNDANWEIDMERIQMDVERITAQADHMAREAEAMARESEQARRMADQERRRIERDVRSEQEAHQREYRQSEEHVQIEEIEVIEEAPEEPRVIVIKSSGDSKNTATEADFEDLFSRICEVYFTDYAGLISQLKPDEKIMLTSKIRGEEGEPDAKISAFVSYKDIEAKNMGKLSPEKLIEKIVYTKTPLIQKKIADLELLASIFQRLYKSDLATTYYTSSPIVYEKLDNYGAIYKMKVYSSYQVGKDNYKIVSQGKTGLTEKERNETVEAMYPAFEQQLKENMVDYGKTLRSLEENESLVFQVALTQCNDCKMPKSVKATIKQSVLSEYNEGKIKREIAISKISIIKGE
ncbi:hypothetical protein N6H18_13920 [Reichenbachiella agarivorans]|uniref:Uncharacterized protein n=1 Tax=Reichenbachiella agarivorans TaxID=2979464 RepID=A0ABY6CPS5_9BACT|nr:hypothetical protein [Reichenbachiella agarivorans]UXP31448.1 hypothetical protein N6H18_13920 [Reichenbachiella agarivorans]